MEKTIETKIVKCLTIAATEEEWRQVLVNPVPFKAKIREALGEMHKPAEKPRAKRSKKAVAPAILTVLCPDCGKEVMPRGLGIHRARAHRQTAAAAE